MEETEIVPMIEAGGAGPSVEERNWAALAHASVLLTLFVGFSTGGLGVVVTMLLPLAMYLAFRERSRYIAFHALQAAAFQAAGALALLILALAFAGSVAVAWVVTGLLSMLLVGLLLIPLALLITLAGAALVVAFPLALTGWALYGAWEVYHDRPFEYRWIGEAVARNMEG